MVVVVVVVLNGVVDWPGLEVVAEIDIVLHYVEFGEGEIDICHHVESVGIAI